VFLRRMFERKITLDQSRDTGMAVVLLMLILCLTLKRKELLVGAVALHVLNMIFPQIYRSVAFFWLGLSDLLGALSSKVLMTIVFFVVVTPVGFFRRLSGKDSLKLLAFKASKDSVMLDRNHVFCGRDLEKPY